MKRPQSFPLRTALLVVCALFPSASISVELSRDGVGQALVLPLFNTNDGMDTLVSVASLGETADLGGPGFVADAVKVRLRDRDGAVLLSFNAYLFTGETLAFALTADESGSRMILGGETCVLFDDGSVTAESADLSLAAREGYIEVFAMGSAEPVAGTPGAELHIAVRDEDCAAVRDMWIGGVWQADVNAALVPPMGKLRASASLIDVERGTLYSLNAVALTEFTDRVFHTPPADPEPDMTSVHDADTDEGATRSRVCVEGVCEELTWSRPVDAVTAVFMVRKMWGDVVISPALDAATEWVFTYPTRYAYEFPAGPTQSALDLKFWDRKGSDLVCNPNATGPRRAFSQWSFTVSQNQASLYVVSFNDGASDLGNVRPSPLLGIESQVVLPTDKCSPLPHTGQVGIGLDSQPVRSNDDSFYLGAPVIGLIFQEYVNGVLTDSDGTPVRANYGNAIQPATRRARAR